MYAGRLRSVGGVSVARALSVDLYDGYPPVPPAAVLVAQGVTPAGVAYWRHYDAAERRTYLVMRTEEDFEMRTYRGNVTLPCCGGR